MIAFVNAAIWGIVVPPFQVPDETSHFAYAQYLAETGRPPPQGPGNPFSRQEQLALHKLWYFSVVGHVEQRAVLNPLEDRELHAALAHSDPVGAGGASSASNQPPLYYAIEAVPYLLVPSGDLLTRLALMRLVSALMAACTVLAIFLFLRELLPRSPWAWTVGALVVAFQPTFDFIAAGVQVDNLLFLTAAATFLMLLRSYRRGLTVRRAAIIGAVVAAGLLTKVTFIALLPGVALALALLVWRASERGQARRALGTAAAIAAVPVALYAALNVALWHRGGPTGGGLAEVASNHVARGGTVTAGQTLEYIWQLYLPRLWFMPHEYFPHYPLWATWFNGAIGHFGWLDYTFPGWVYSDSRYVLYGLLALAAIGLLRMRRGVRELLPLFVCFAVMAIGLLAAIGYAGIRFRLDTGNQFEQARYIFPLLPFYALFVVLAARAAGARWAPALGAALVVLAMAHGLFAETLTIARYYG